VYKLLIIDDEYITRQGIINHIDFTPFDIMEIQEADDGINGLRVAETFHPDIVISDIKMPRMDGVNFAFKLKKILPDCRIIFMSAYTELDYYRNAIKLNAISYIEKPIDLDELKQSLQNAVDDLMQYAHYESMSKQVDELIQTNKEVLRSQLSTLFIQNNGQEETIITKAKELHMHLDTSHHYYVTILIKQYIKDRLDPYDQGLSKKRMSALLDRFLKPLSLDYVMHFKGNVTVITLIAQRHHRLVISHEKLEVVFSEIYEALKDTCQLTISIGKVVDHIKEIHDSYVTAVVTGERLFFKKGLSLDYYRHIHGQGIYTMDNSQYTIFNEHLEQSNKMDCVLLVKHLTEAIRGCVNTPKGNVVDMYMRLYALLNHYIQPMQEGINGKSTDMAWHALSKMVTLDALEAYMIEHINLYFTLLHEQDQVGSMAIRVKQIIHKDYGDSNLTVEGISHQLGVTKNYLSALFKKELSITINKYLTKYRMDKAKIKLRDTKYKIEVIAHLSGYEDSDYFSKVFKKYVQCTPREYRQKFLK